MDLEKLIAILKEKEVSADVISFVEGLKPVNNETVKDYLENTDEGKRLSQSLTDARVTKGIETFKTQTLPKLLEDEIAKRNPQETTEQKKLRELESRQNELVAELKRKDLLNSAIKKATERGLPVSIIDRFLGEDEEGTDRNLGLFEETFKKAIEAHVKEKFKQGGREPGQGGTPPATSKEGEPSDLTKALLQQV